MSTPRIFGKSLTLGIQVVLAALALGTAATGVAEAQYYQPGPGYYREAPPPGYYRERQRPRPRYEDEGYVVRPRQRAFGSVCVTSRGNCSVGRAVPLQSGCVCNIPGFGQKRGHVQY